MSTARKRERAAGLPADRVYLDDLLDQALGQSSPASDSVAIDLDSPADLVASESRRK